MSTERLARVLVLGGTGMLGSMILDVLDRAGGFYLGATARDRNAAAIGHTVVPSVQWHILDATNPAIDEPLARVLPGWDWVINAIGMIKHLIREDDDRKIEQAIRVNTLFPHVLARQAEALGVRVLQIATDCVFSGGKGGSQEDDAHDPLDVYGKTKSLGEVCSPAVHHLRCSIIGPESRGHRSLLEWFRGQPRGSELSGFTNHRWNGLTTLHFARLCAGIIATELPIPAMHHVVPADAISKHDLLRCFAHAFSRSDLVITPTGGIQPVDRTLWTDDEAMNRRLWAAAGYSTAPTIARMVEELAVFPYRWNPGLTCPARGQEG